MTLEEEVAALKERVKFLEDVFGTKFVGMDSSQLAASLIPANQIGNRYPYWLSDYQIRVGIGRLEELFDRPVDSFGSVPQPPPPE